MEERNFSAHEWDEVEARAFSCAQNAHQIKKPMWPEPYCEDSAEACFRFLTECCWTYNEANPGQETIPALDYIRVAVDEWWECRRTGKPFIIEKSRRLVMSWVLRGCELWRLGLRPEVGVIAGLTYEKSAEHVWRIWWLYKELRNRKKSWDLKEHVGRGGNEQARAFDQVLLPNGSVVESLNQAGASFQGSGYSFVTMEEFSLYSHADYMWAQALRVTQGKPGHVGGSVVVVTNASANKAWQGIKEPVARGLGLGAGGEGSDVRRTTSDVTGKEAGPAIPDGVELRECQNGARYLKIHYSADPSKDAAWAAAERKKTPVKEWLREMEMREDVFEGEPVYADYSDKWHCMLQEKEVPVTRGSFYIGGWDCGQTLTPAFTLLQITPKPWQVQCILEVISPGAEPMEKFAPRVLFALQKRIPHNWDEVEHWADQTVVQKSGANGETAQEAARKHGLRLRPASNQWAGRFGAVTWLLMDEIALGEDRVVPRFVVDGVHCPVLREGFKGAYKLDESPSGESVGPGRVLKEKPLKNSYSHVHDSLQYAASRVKKLFRNGRFQFE